MHNIPLFELILDYSSKKISKRKLKFKNSIKLVSLFYVILKKIVSLHSNFKKKFFVMKSLRPFLLPVKGLTDGLHQYQFQISSNFFKEIDSASSIKGNFTVDVDLEKKYGMYELDFSIDGSLLAPCDRCLEQISIPIESEYKLIVKIGVGEDDLDIVFIEEMEDHLDISKYVYDYILLSFPMMNIIEDCDLLDPMPCNEEILDKLESEVESEQKEKDVWAELKKLNLDN